MPFGLRLSALSRSQLAEVIRREPAPQGGGPRVICTANLDHIVHLQSNKELRAAYANAWTVTADGTPVFLYARLRRAPVPARVTGADLMSDLVGTLKPGSHRCFFVASSAQTSEGLCAMMLARGFRAEDIDSVVPPFGFEKDNAYSTELALRIKRHQTSHLFLGVGAPKSEIWVNKHRDLIGDCYVLNAGAGLDFACGARVRAPVWMRRSGLEWVWRFGSEPRRLFKRYFIDSWQFLGAIYNDLTANPDAQLEVPRAM
jgi:N-acetylglucosaminyldiphosphoundecaprenol N-acetyl-beta-D-mannosaminyltransferase